VIAEADRSRSAIMVALDMALALRSLRPFRRCAALLATVALFGSRFARSTMLRPRLLRTGVLPIALARGILALRAMLAWLLAGFEALRMRSPQRLGMPFAVLAWPTGPVGTVRRTVAAGPAAARLATAGTFSRSAAPAASTSALG
jgi:hypothetical protein